MLKLYGTDLKRNKNVKHDRLFLLYLERSISEFLSESESLKKTSQLHKISVQELSDL